ncbi:Mu transposase domain-containing protein [Streptomyces atratus]|uniref:Mu transposase domain-containing protein n=1 Tax=Streptomyces atratus TaxID=1893 RepID=UPI00324514D6
MGGHAHLLVGALAHSGRWRAVLAESEDFPHLVQALDGVVRKLGGTARRWRFDRMATVCYPSSGQVTAAFAAVAKYYGVGVDICPPRRGNRKGVVEKANHSAAQRWWRTVPDGLTVVQAQSGVDKLSLRMDDRRRRIDGVVTTVGELAAAEPLLDIPVRPFPAEIEVERTVSPQSLVAFDGNFYSVPPGLPGVTVKVLHRLGEDDLRVVTAGRAVVACHRRAPRGAGQTVRDDGHVIALERAVLSSFSDRAPCKTKVRKPPSAAALAEAERLREGPPAGSSAERVVIDLTHYAAVADRLRSVPSPKQEENPE